MFDCTAFIRRMGWRQKDLAERLNIGTSTVGMWCTGKSTPPYENIMGLIKLGITMKELFGEDVAEIIMRQYMPEAAKNTEFLEGLKAANDPESALNAIVERKILEMKEKGLI